MWLESRRPLRKGSTTFSPPPLSQLMAYGGLRGCTSREVQLLYMHVADESARGWDFQSFATCVCVKVTPSNSQLLVSVPTVDNLSRIDQTQRLSFSSFQSEPDDFYCLSFFFSPLQINNLIEFRVQRLIYLLFPSIDIWRCALNWCVVKVPHVNPLPCEMALLQICWVRELSILLLKYIDKDRCASSYRDRPDGWSAAKDLANIKSWRLQDSSHSAGRLPQKHPRPHEQAAEERHLR